MVLIHWFVSNKISLKIQTAQAVASATFKTNALKSVIKLWSSSFKRFV